METCGPRPGRRRCRWSRTPRTKAGKPSSARSLAYILLRSRVQANDRPWLFGRRGKTRRRGRHVGLWRARRLAHVGLDIAAVVAVQQMAGQPPNEGRGAEQPYHDPECQVHVALHHDRLIVMGGVMTPDGVDERGIAHEPVVIDMAAEMHEL